MAEFCKCGSIIINKKCSNKNCDIKVVKDGVSNKSVPETTKKSPAKKANSARKNSKVVTYKLSDLESNDSTE